MPKYLRMIFAGSFLFILFAGFIMADSIFLSPADFETFFDDNHMVTDYYKGDYLHNYAGATYRHFLAPVHLPEGASITSVTVIYEDDSTGAITVYVKRRNMYSHVTQSMATWSTTGDVSGWRSYKITHLTYPNINNEGYGYWVWLYFSDQNAGTDLRIDGIKINYTP